MRRFWQSIALLLLVLLAPASVHCLLNEDTHDCCATAGMPCDDAGQTPDSDNDGHECPAESLAKTNLPASVAVPAMPVTALAHEQELLLHIAARTLASFDVITVPPTFVPAELRTCWAFITRAALPVRCPSDLV
jgi:hypothetical protein